MGNCTCKQTSLDLEAELSLSADEEEEVLPPTESEEKAEEEEELLEEEELEADDDEELELEDEEEEEELELSEEKKDLGKLKDMLLAAVKYLENDKKAEDSEVTEVGKALATLKKNGVNVYAGKKATPAPRRVAAKKPQQTNWMNFSKSIDDINLDEERNNGGMYTWQG